MTGQRDGRRADVLPDGPEVAGRDDGVGRQAVHLGLVEQQEERTVAADAVLGIATVEAGDVEALLVQLGQAPVGALVELAQLSELDRLGGAGLGTGRASGPPSAGRSRACT